MRPESPLPLQSQWQGDYKSYTAALLTFITTSTLHRNLCGGVHILDFLTRTPDLYEHVLPQSWRTWLDTVQIDDFLDLLMRDDVERLLRACPDPDSKRMSNEASTRWKGYELPPRSLLEYIFVVRTLSFDRTFRRNDGNGRKEPTLPRHIAVGMKPKKVHEVAHFSRFVDQLCEDVSQRRRRRDGKIRSGTAQASGSTSAVTVEMNAGIGADLEPVQPVLIDFGSGQAYLGRTLASPPYDKAVIAIEGREHNVEGAKGMDVHAKIAAKEKIWRNKKEFKRLIAEGIFNMKGEVLDHDKLKELEERHNEVETTVPNGDLDRHPSTAQLDASQPNPPCENDSASGISQNPSCECNDIKKGSIIHMTHSLTSGQLPPLPTRDQPSIVISLHSCGNLTHHGLRSLTLNPSVKAVALIGCCYNLLTERLGPPTYKLPQLRSMHPRLKETSEAQDQDGFPMSQRFEQHEFEINSKRQIPIPDLDFLKYLPTTLHPTNRTDTHSTNQTLSPNSADISPVELKPTEKGVRLNITSRMMAVQAPSNWGPTDSAEFFTRHFYRALLQRILLDYGVVQMPASDADTSAIEAVGGSLSGSDDIGTPLIIGALRKAAFADFPTYARAAVEKLTAAEDARAIEIKSKMDWVHEDRDGLLQQYQTRFEVELRAKHKLSVIWSLMAFSASVVESAIVLDRWLWLCEQDEVEDAWVEVGFESRLSPRNLVVVGIKADDGGSDVDR